MTPSQHFPMKHAIVQCTCQSSDLWGRCIWPRSVSTSLIFKNISTSIYLSVSLSISPTSIVRGHMLTNLTPSNEWLKVVSCQKEFLKKWEKTICPVKNGYNLLKWFQMVPVLNSAWHFIYIHLYDLSTPMYQIHKHVILLKNRHSESAALH